MLPVWTVRTPLPRSYALLHLYAANIRTRPLRFTDQRRLYHLPWLARGVFLLPRLLPLSPAALPNLRTHAHRAAYLPYARRVVRTLHAHGTCYTAPPHTTHTHTHTHTHHTPPPPHTRTHTPHLPTTLTTTTSARDYAVTVVGHSRSGWCTTLP